METERKQAEGEGGNEAGREGGLEGNVLWLMTVTLGRQKERSP